MSGTNCTRGLDRLLQGWQDDEGGIFSSSFPVRKGESPEVVFLPAAAVIALVSLLLLSRGALLLRPLAAVSGALIGATVGLSAGKLISPPLSCEARLATSGVFAICLSLLSLFAVRLAAFAVTTGGAVALVHFSWDAIPLLRKAQGPFAFAGREGWYFFAVAGGAICGAIAYCKEKKWVHRVVSSCLGGAGVATTIHVLFLRYAPPSSLLGRKGIPPVPYLATVLALGAIGTFVQSRAKRERGERGERETRPRQR